MKNGDYVLATKYSDGDPHDQWCIGIYEEQIGDRHWVIDIYGNQFRHNGFRRVKKITKERGEFILRHMNIIEYTDRSLWWWVRCSMDSTGV
jgi:hypothetical protein